MRENCTSRLSERAEAGRQAPPLPTLQQRSRRTRPGDRQRRRWSEGRGPRRTRADAARAGHRAGKACHRRRSAYGRPQGFAVTIRGGSRMRGALGEAGMSLPVQVWPVQSLASRTGASLTGVTATWGPERRQRLDGVWDRLPKSAYCGGRAGACTSEGSTSALATREGVMHRRGLRPGHVRTAHAGT